MSSEDFERISMVSSPFRNSKSVLTQRGQYGKGGAGQWFRKFRDRKAFSMIDKECHWIIDLGCGEGITLEKLLESFPEKSIAGIDVSKGNIRVCIGYNLPVICGDVRHLSLKTESVDCCILMDVIEHIGEPERVLEEISRILRPRGTLILVFPNDRMFFLARLLFLKLKEAFHDPGHVQDWNPKKMRRLLERRGFRVEQRMNLPFFLWPLSLYHLLQARKR